VQFLCDVVVGESHDRTPQLFVGDINERGPEVLAGASGDHRVLGRRSALVARGALRRQQEVHRLVDDESHRPTLPAGEQDSQAEGMAANDAAIAAQNLRKSYGDTHAVDGVDLEVGRGEVFALLGPNGAGQDDRRRDPGGIPAP
jgi:ABC-type glutathione transport system ATPase component